MDAVNAFVYRASSFTRRVNEPNYPVDSINCENKKRKRKIFRIKCVCKGNVVKWNSCRMNAIDMTINPFAVNRFMTQRRRSSQSHNTKMELKLLIFGLWMHLIVTANGKFLLIFYYSYWKSTDSEGFWGILRSVSSSSGFHTEFRLM